MMSSFTFQLNHEEIKRYRKNVKDDENSSQTPAQLTNTLNEVSFDNLRLIENPDSKTRVS